MVAEKDGVLVVGRATYPSLQLPSKEPEKDRLRKFLIADDDQNVCFPHLEGGADAIDRV